MVNFQMYFVTFFKRPLGKLQAYNSPNNKNLRYIYINFPAPNKMLKYTLYLFIEPCVEI